MWIWSEFSNKANNNDNCQIHEEITFITDIFKFESLLREYDHVV